jgi:hypothetical protein
MRQPPVRTTDPESRPESGAAEHEHRASASAAFDRNGSNPRRGCRRRSLHRRGFRASGGLEAAGDGGSGFLWMVSAAGSGELLFTPRIAAQCGYTLLWAMVAAVMFKWFINRETGRSAVCTGASVLEGFKSPRGHGTGPCGSSWSHSSWLPCRRSRASPTRPPLHSSSCYRETSECGASTTG